MPMHLRHHVHLYPHPRYVTTSAPSPCVNPSLFFPLVDYGVATTSRLLQIIGLFCKRDVWKDDILQKRLVIVRSRLIVATTYALFPPSQSTYVSTFALPVSQPPYFHRSFPWKSPTIGGSFAKKLYLHIHHRYHHICSLAIPLFS